VVTVVLFAAVDALDAVLPCWEQAARATAGRRATIAGWCCGVLKAWLNRTPCLIARFS
jgi:hypothetical protein